MKRRGRKGFTLVELLVVITIISMLMALLMPAVQSARESGRRAVCLNNQKNLALALLNYESARRNYPGFVEYLGAWGRDTSTPPKEIPVGPNSSGVVGEVTGNDYSADLQLNDVTWTVAILPYLDRNDLWKAWSDRTVHCDQESSGSAASFLESILLPKRPARADRGGCDADGLCRQLRQAGQPDEHYFVGRGLQRRFPRSQFPACALGPAP